MSSKFDGEEPVTFGKYGQLVAKASDAKLKAILDGAAIPADGVAAFEAARDLAVKLLPLFKYRDWHGTVKALMVKRWLSRCANLCGEDTIEVAIKEAIKIVERASVAAYDKRVAAEDEQRDRKRKAEREAAERAAKENSKSALVKKAADELNVLEHQVRRLLREQATVPKTADVLAKYFGGERADWLRPQKRRGRQAHATNRFTKVYIEECTIRDYVNSEPELVGDVGALAEKLRENFRYGRIAEDHYPVFDDFRRVARSLDFEADTAEKLWFVFQCWRGPRIGEIYVAGAEADYYGFG